MLDKLIAISLTFALALVAVSCTDSDEVVSDVNVTPPPDQPALRTPAQLTDQEKDLLASCNSFGLKLFKEVNASTPNTENVFISPLSASYALGMAYNGAKGETRVAIANTLEFAGLPVDEVNQVYHDLTAILTGADPLVQMSLANSLWSRQGKAIVPEFSDVCRQFFDARVEEIDFQAPWAADTINAWVTNATGGKIDDMVQPPLSPDIAAMLFNAIYFKGSWMFPFDTADTRTVIFHLADGTATECRMMSKDEADCQKPGPAYPSNPHDTHTDTNITWYSDDEVLVLGMPYGAGDYRMSIVLPNPGWDWPPSDSVSIDGVIAGLTYEKWTTWLGGNTPNKFDLGLPRFRFKYDVSFKDMLIALGMEIAFDAGRADFSNLFSDGVGWIDEVKHKTFVQVDEKGTEAAAVTQIIFIDSAPPQMICNRPFLIVIHEDVSGAILFIGKIANPVWEEE